MGYFGARVGKPVEPVGQKLEKNADEKFQVGSLFSASLGCRPQGGNPTARGAGIEGNPEHVIDREPESLNALKCCPLCRGELVEEGGTYRCRGRCGSLYVESTPGYLVDVALLPFGVCSCCVPPQPLAGSEDGAICPQSGTAYLLLPEGVVPLTEAAPHGVCQCCHPPMPLVWNEERLTCRAKPQNQYRMQGGRLVLVQTPGQPQLEQTLQAIDAALSQNSARVTLYGLFDL